MQYTQPAQMRQALATRHTAMLAVLVMATACASSPPPLVPDGRGDPWTFPVQGSSLESVISTWGDNRSGGRSHEGIDIAAPRGTPVIAATGGRISRVEVTTRGGLVVWVAESLRQRHYYAHLDSTADLRVGQWVRAGELIGTVGDSGNAIGGPPHLHYGLYQDRGQRWADWRAVDPGPWLKLAVPKPL